MVLLLSVPAGRSTRRSNSKWVDPEPEKGLIELEFDDDLLRFWWKNRVTGAKEDELIIFPSEATFEKVQQDPSGRTHALRFHTGSTLNFYWFQRASSEGDMRAMVDINALIEDPTYQVGSAPLPEVSAPSGPIADAERSWPPTPGAPKLSHPVPGPPSASSAAAGTSAAAASAAPASGNAQTDMARMLMEWAQQGGLGATQEDARLTDVLSPVNMATLLSSRPNLVSTIKPLLPAQLNLPPDPTVQDLLPILSAPQFTDAIASLDNALRSGGLPGGMMRELGLPESAGTGVKEFLEALKGLKSDDSMEQD